LKTRGRTKKRAKNLITGNYRQNLAQKKAAKERLFKLNLL
jgi:hypothetical protein